MTPRERRWLVAAVAGSLTLRLVLAVAALAVGDGPSAFHVPDTARYLALANEILERGAFSLDGQPELFRLPGLPVLIAAAAATGFPTAGTIVLHAVLGALTTWLCFVAGRDAVDVRTGLLAATLHAVEPTQWASSNLVMTETLFVALVAACFAAAARYLSTMRARWLIVATLAACASAYVRFVGYLLPVALLAAVSWIVWRSGAPQDRAWLRHVTAAAALAVVTLGAWHVRNGIATGYWGFSVQLERAAYFMGGATVAARQAGTSYAEAVDRMPGSGLSAQAANPASPSADTMRRFGLARIVEHPILFASTYAAGVGATLLHPGTATVMRPFHVDDAWNAGTASATQLATLGRWDRARAVLAQKGTTYWLLTVPLLIVNLAYLVLFLLGARRAWSRPGIRLACLLVMYFVALSGGPDADSRRRVPIVPMVCVAAAARLRLSR